MLTANAKTSGSARTQAGPASSLGPGVRTLYVCYFGLREPLVRTQVIAYLRQLAMGGIEVSLLTFEPRLRQNWSLDQIAEERAALKSQGIEWTCLKYHKWPSLPATLYDIARGVVEILRIMRREKITALHARNHVPALMCAIAKQFISARLIFDIRGFMPEEYTDAGVWPANGYLYRGLKRVERYLFRVSDAFVVLTEKARDILFPGSVDRDGSDRPVEVIPCCVDFERFDHAERISRTELRAKLGIQDRRVIVYLGSFGGWYMTGEMMEFIATARRQDPSTFALILTQSPQSIVAAKMREVEIEDRDFLVTYAKPEDVPRYLRAADFAISFIKPCYSKLSSSPTKIAEYLASGLPIVCNAGVGDLDQLINENRLGVVLREFSHEAYLEALKKVDALRRDEAFAEHARQVARQQFDLTTVGGRKYRRLYRRLFAEGNRAVVSAPVGTEATPRTS